MDTFSRPQKGSPSREGSKETTMHHDGGLVPT